MQELVDPRRWVNIDETPNCERGEKSGHKACVLVSADAMQVTGKAPVRVRVLNDGNGPLTMVPALRGDGVVPAVGFLTAGACLTPQAAQGEAVLLPGVPADIFADGLKARIYETPCGSMNVATLELFQILSAGASHSGNAQRRSYWAFGGGIGRAALPWAHHAFTQPTQGASSLSLAPAAQQQHADAGVGR